LPPIAPPPRKTPLHSTDAPERHPPGILRSDALRGVPSKEEDESCLSGHPGVEPDYETSQPRRMHCSSPPIPSPLVQHRQGRTPTSHPTPPKLNHLCLAVIVSNTPTPTRGHRPKTRHPHTVPTRDVLHVQLPTSSRHHCRPPQIGFESNSFHRDTPAPPTSHPRAKTAPPTQSPSSAVSTNRLAPPVQ